MIEDRNCLERLALIDDHVDIEVPSAVHGRIQLGNLVGGDGGSILDGDLDYFLSDDEGDSAVSDLLVYGDEGHIGGVLVLGGIDVLGGACNDPSLELVALAGDVGDGEGVGLLGDVRFALDLECDIENRCGSTFDGDESFVMIYSVRERDFCLGLIPRISIVCVSIGKWRSIDPFCIIGGYNLDPIAYDEFYFVVLLPVGSKESIFLALCGYIVLNNRPPPQAKANIADIPTATNNL